MPVTFVNNDPEEEPNSAKRSKLHRDQADAFKEGQSQYCQTAAKGLQQAVLINGQIKQDREMACTDGLLSDVVARHPFRPIEILEAGHMRFFDESPVVKSRRQMLIHALQAISSELVLFPGMNPQLVVHVATVDGPFVDKQHDFAAALH